MSCRFTMGPFDHHCTHEADALVDVRLKLLLSVSFGLALEPMLVLLLRHLDSSLCEVPRRQLGLAHVLERLAPVRDPPDLLG